MATAGGGSQFALLWSLASFLWLVHHLDSHQIVEQPRLSSVLCLFISGACAFAVSFFSLWLPGANGRFDDDLGGLRGLASAPAPRASLPKKPRRFFLPTLVFCIILRLEIFHQVSFSLQCSASGVQVWLPLVILFHELLPRQKLRSLSEDDKIEDDDMGQTVFDALFGTVATWFHGSSLPLMASVLALTYSTHIISSQLPKSTLFCSSMDNRATIVFFQCVGVLLDASLIIMFWRVLAWTRTTKARLRMLSVILMSSSGGMGFIYLVSQLLQPAKPMSYHFRGLDSLYCFDIVVDGLTLAVFLISTSLLTTDSSPLSLVTIVVFIDGFLLATKQLRLISSWENISPFTTSFCLVLICSGFICFMYIKNLRSVAFLHRTLIVFFLLVAIIVATVYTLVYGRQVFESHPLDHLIYKGRVKADRFLLQASVSDSLLIAVQEYKERQGGRNPPPKFDVWYQFAKERKSVFIDHFDQIHQDLLPFYGMTPEKIRQSIQKLEAEPQIVVARIQNGNMVHNLLPGSPHKATVDDLSSLIQAFGRHLPDGLQFAVNLNDRPRVLAPWEDKSRFSAMAKQQGLSALLTRRSSEGAPSAKDILQNRDTEFITSPSNHTAPRAFREMIALACPPCTGMRSGVYWDVKKFCSSCARPQSHGQYLKYWATSLELCHQPDLFRSHGFHISPPDLRPLQELLPIFSRSKTNGFSDILIPLNREGGNSTSGDREFGMKRRQLFWRGKLDANTNQTPGLLRGGHQERLSHLINNASASDKTTMLVPTSGKTGRYVYEEASNAMLNAVLPMDIGFSEIANSQKAARHEFGLKPEDDAMMSQLVLVMDTENGPPRDVLKVLRSNSVPFLSTIFKEWYTERLVPWVHFVPIDIRFHALHNTLAYFTGLGLSGKHKINGRTMKMDANVGNAEWIADEGRRFAAKATRREDMEVYMFRLLLEWSRLVNDERDKLGFVL